jgi:4-aminobutyrate aminotransferase-like enzyme
MSEGSGTPGNDSIGELRQRRVRALGPTYRHFYRQPLHLVRGEGCWLFDVQGRRYLDCYNNVASVGHCRPEVVQALAQQAATLNTHTRYLHENVVRYAERLAATLPDPLEVCLFVCTGTEANDLAFRIARSVTGNSGAIVSENSYHGNSMVVTQLSTAEYPVSEHPDWLAALPVPDPLRGRWPASEAGWGSHYAALAGTAIGQLAERGHRPAMFLCDTIFDACGVLVPPDGYLAEVYAQVRAAGGLCVADEVQSGLCRLGDHTWGFMDHGVVPDIVTLGKPIGNGHPLAAVVTTREIAEAFARKYHYFNTFGGNPVSAAVGLAVLDVLEKDSILAQVHDTGALLAEGLHRLAAATPQVAEVRGKGLFYGLDMVRSAGETLPDPGGAERLCHGLLERGILTATCGPYDNVLKIRPPLMFNRANAEQLLDALGECLAAEELNMQ